MIYRTTMGIAQTNINTLLVSCSTMLQPILNYSLLVLAAWYPLYHQMGKRESGNGTAGETLAEIESPPNVNLRFLGLPARVSTLLPTCYLYQGDATRRHWYALKQGIEK